MTLCTQKNNIPYWQNAYLAPIIDTNTLLYFTSDFGTATTWNDLSGNFRDGTPVNAIRISTDTKGLFGTHYKLNGTTSYVNISDTVGIITDNPAFTISTWFKTTSIAAGSLAGALYCEAIATAPYPLIQIITGDPTAGSVSFSVRDTTGSTSGMITVSNVNANNGIWHNLVGIQNSKSDRKLYFDGILVGQNTAVVGTTTTNNAKVGVQNRNSGFFRYFSGDIGSVLIYNRALSEAEMISNYQNSPFYYLSKVFT